MHAGSTCARASSSRYDAARGIATRCESVGPWMAALDDSAHACRHVRRLGARRRSRPAARGDRGRLASKLFGSRACRPAQHNKPAARAHVDARLRGAHSLTRSRSATPTLACRSKAALSRAGGRDHGDVGSHSPWHHHIRSRPRGLCKWKRRRCLVCALSARAAPMGRVPLLRVRTARDEARRLPPSSLRRLEPDGRYQYLRHERQRLQQWLSR